MRIIALMNQKGGVGKTTTTANLGAALAERGKRVCLIDLDPQAHLTINYGLEPAPDLISLYHLLTEDRGFLEAVHQISEHIAIVPSSIDLAAAEIELVTVIGREMLLKKRVEAATHDFDYILLDCPPALGLLTINALAVATEVIIPMQAHFLALQGVAKLLETVQLVNKRMNPKLKVSGIVLTMYDSQTKLSMEVVQELNTFIEQGQAHAAQGKMLPWSEAKIFKSRIRRNIKLAESPSFGETILTYDSGSNGAADYRALALEVIAMEGAVASKPAVAAAPPAKPVTTPARPLAAQPAAAAVSEKKPVSVAPAARPASPVTAPPTLAVNPSLQPAKLAAARVTAVPKKPMPKVDAPQPQNNR